MHGVEKIFCAIYRGARYPLEAARFGRHPIGFWQWLRRICSSHYHADLLARSEFETGDIECVGKGMFAQRLIRFSSGTITTDIGLVADPDSRVAGPVLPH